MSIESHPDPPCLGGGDSHVGPGPAAQDRLPAVLPGAPLRHLLPGRGRHPRLDALVLRLRRPRPLVLRPPRQDREALQGPDSK